MTTRYLQSKDGQRTVIVPNTDALHALSWGRLLGGSKPANVVGEIVDLSETDARDWIMRERAA